MHFMMGCRHFARVLLLFGVGAWLLTTPADGQDTGDEGTLSRGSRAEIAVTVRDASGQVLAVPTTVKLYKDGAPTDQTEASRGRAFFVPRTLGDFTIVVEAAGYKSAQKDVSVQVAVLEEVDVYLEKETTRGTSAGVPGQPLLAPKAKELLRKGLEALKADKLETAKKCMSEVMRLAPGNPEVLYAEGLLEMKERNWAQAQGVLEKSNQIEPNQPRVLAALGMTLCNQKKYEGAIPLLETSLKLEPASGWETQWALAKSYYYQGQYEPALKLAEQARSSAHEPNPQVELLLAQCLTAGGRYEDAAQVLRQLLKNNAEGPDAATARRWLDGLVTNGKIRQ
jgi:predicted Zn-dependent protease